MAKNKFTDNRKTIVLDFNGVLDTYEGWKGETYMYPPREGVADFLKALRAMGFQLVIMSAANIVMIANWLKKYELNTLIDGITDHKIPAIMYVDDRGITFKGDFQQTLEDIKNFKVYWGGDT